MQWIATITELPPEGCEVLCFWPGHPLAEYQRVAVWDGDSWGSPSTDYPRYSYEKEPDAWMRLPAPPPTPTSMPSWRGAIRALNESGSALRRRLIGRYHSPCHITARYHRTQPDPMPWLAHSVPLINQGHRRTTLPCIFRNAYLQNPVAGSVRTQVSGAVHPAPN